jgi:hypothetical protein
VSQTVKKQTVQTTRDAITPGKPDREDKHKHERSSRPVEASATEPMRMAGLMPQRPGMDETRQSSGFGMRRGREAWIGRAWALWLLLPVTNCATPNHADHSSEVAMVQDAIDAALIANDPDKLAPHLTADATRTGPGGVMTSRAQWLGSMRSGQIRYRSVRRTGLVDIEVFKPDTGIVMEHNRFLRVYVRQSGTWLLAAHQATAAPAGQRCSP